jgi:hypothetical protein
MLVRPYTVVNHGQGAEAVSSGRDGEPVTLRDMRGEPRDPAEVAAEMWPEAYAGVRATGDVHIIAFTRDATALGAELRRRTGADVHVELAPRAPRAETLTAKALPDRKPVYR